MFRFQFKSLADLIVLLILGGHKADRDANAGERVRGQISAKRRRSDKARAMRKMQTCSER
jgi:hypothetical protein